MFGCGDPLPLSNVRWSRAPDVDRLGHMDELDQSSLATAFEARRRGAALGIDPTHVSASTPTPHRVGRIHVLPSTSETVRLGVFDATLPNLLDIESGDVVVYPDTWSHFLNRVQPGVGIDELAQLRRENPGRGPHSIVGPVGVRGAEPGDMLAIHFQRLIPVDWGVTFVNPGDLGTGTLPSEFPTGQARYLDLDLASMTTEFLPGINLPVAPFQGTFGVAPTSGGVVSSVPPGQHAGNIDLRDLTEGAILYVPVFQTSGKLFTGDSHAAQGDGEVNNQALESAMREVRVQVVLHKHAGWQWPFAETDTHWYVLGIHADLNEAFRIATRTTIEFLHHKAGLTRLDAYSLASIGMSFRVTQFVDQTRGVHAMLPKAIFSEARRREISIC